MYTTTYIILQWNRIGELGVLHREVPLYTLTLVLHQYCTVRVGGEACAQ